MRVASNYSKVVLGSICMRTGLRRLKIVLALAWSLGRTHTSHGLSLAVFAVLAATSAPSVGQELYLSCSLVGSANQTFRYSFAFGEAKATLLWVEGNQELRVVRNTATQLWASHDGKFRKFPHDATDFRLNRVTGAAEVNYLHRPLPAEVANCKKQRSWGCEDAFVLAQFSETGRCTAVERAIK